MTQKELAEKMHISLRTLQNWEQGRAAPNRFTESIFMEFFKDAEGNI